MIFRKEENVRAIHMSDITLIHHFNHILFIFICNKILYYITNKIIIIVLYINYINNYIISLYIIKFNILYYFSIFLANLNLIRVGQQTFI